MLLATSVVLDIPVVEALRSFTDGGHDLSIDALHVGDIIEGFVSVLDQPEKLIGEIINMGSDVEMSTGEGIALIEEIMGKKAKLDIRPKRPGDQLHTCANIGKARHLLGYNPHTQLADGLRAEVDWYVNRIYANNLHTV